MKRFYLSTAIALLAGVGAATVALASEARIERMPDLAGMIFTKDDPNAAEKALEALTGELSTLQDLLTKSKAEMETKYTDLNNHYTGVKADNDELKKQVQQHVGEYAELKALTDKLEVAVNQVKKEIEAPLFRSEKDLADSDKKAAIELQKRIHLNAGGAIEDFKEDHSNLVVAKDLRSAANKLMQLGLKDKATIIRSFTEAEKKAFDAASMDAAFFSPELLGMEVDCNIECADITDLYRQINVSKSTFMYPQVLDYGEIGKYSCDATCDAETGPEGNITYKNGQTYEFRGAFCFNNKVLREANYPLLDFIMRSAQRSYRINRNRVMMVGDGVNEPRGWLNDNCFDEILTSGLQFNASFWRRFVASAPVEYGPVVAVMHQNVFAYLAAITDTTGRFLFGDGDMFYTPAQTSGIRISNCLPDATEDGTKGDEENPFTAGDYLATIANWDMAIAQVTRSPMIFRQFMGGSNMWCSKYEFGAEDGGATLCCAAGRTLRVGA
jgi:HK97 family phage major capsid protein